MIKILDADAIRRVDENTIKTGKLKSIGLMESASQAFAIKFLELYPSARHVEVYCGRGNNGGDGLAIARILHGKGISVNAKVLSGDGKGSDDFQTNLQRAEGLFPAVIVENESELNGVCDAEVAIDALFGSGLSRSIQGLAAKVVSHLNRSDCDVVAVDMPSGMYMNKATTGESIIEAVHTITFQLPKLAMMMTGNTKYFGEAHVVNIGLSESAIEKEKAEYWLYGIQDAKPLLKRRPVFSHKGNFGHALLIAGSRGQMGAAVMAAESCLRSGVGLLSISCPRVGEDILQVRVPEAMCHASQEEETVDGNLPTKEYDCIGIGPGIGKSPKALAALVKVLETAQCPVVIDADGLNLLGENRELLKKMPKNTVLTPHPKEFERLTEKVSDDFHRLRLAKDFAKEHKVTLVLKGGRTTVADADGVVTFNPTGNAGMATGGSGDVLTGILTGILAQGHSPQEAARFAVYIHGLAGDLAAEELGQEAMLATDITGHLAKAFMKLK